MDKNKTLGRARKLFKEQGETKDAQTLDGFPFKWNRTYYYVSRSIMGTKLFYKIRPTKGSYLACGQGDAARLFCRVFPVDYRINQLVRDRTNHPENLRTAGEWK